MRVRQSHGDGRAPVHVRATPSASRRRVANDRPRRTYRRGSRRLGPPPTYRLYVRFAATQAGKPSRGLAFHQRGQRRAEHRGSLLQSGVRSGLGHQVVVQCDSRAHRIDFLMHQASHIAPNDDHINAATRVLTTAMPGAMSGGPIQRTQPPSPARSTPMTTVNANIAAPRLLLVAAGAVKQIAEVLGKFGLSRPLIVSDPFMVKLGLIDRCLAPLAAAGIEADVFSDTVPEPNDTDRGRRRGVRQSPVRLPD